MIDMRMSITPADYSNRLRHRLSKQRVQSAMRQAAMRVAALGTLALQHHAPKKTGAFAASIRPTIVLLGNNLAIRWNAMQPLAGWIIGGTRPHLIVPRSASVLRFETASGDVVFATLVHHPGTKPNDFRRPALAEIRPLLLAEFHNALAASLQL